jgi:DNA mismatch repair protein MutS2
LTPYSLKALEFETVREALMSLAGCAAGRERLASLQPLDDAALVRLALDLTSEGARVLRAPGRQPYHDLPEVREWLQAARLTGYHLEPSALRDVASFIEGAAEIGRRVARASTAPRLAHLACQVCDASDVAGAIRRAILPSGEVADGASPRLAEIRRTLLRLKAQLHSVMESYLRGKDAERLLQDKVVTTRNERCVLLLRADHRGQLPGVIHGASGSGATLFVEPLPAVELNNDIVALADEERSEVIRILTELTALVGRRADELEHSLEVLGRLDAVQAQALLAAEMDACAPEITDRLDLDLREARHPLLMPRLMERLGVARRRTQEPVPVSLRVGFGEPVLIISGPNTGGKTVALKTIGLLSLMAQCGLHVPAAEGSVLPVFRRVFADIGDDQSIAADLSTFSAHLSALTHMTQALATPALVLLDEVGSGTDPREGGPLGVAVVDHFRRRGAMVVATTHDGLMKSYAQSTPGVACASFGYDPQTYAPTYRLRLGEPGRSLALEMAERLGLPAEVVQDARSRLSAGEVRAEELLRRMDEEQAALQRERTRLEDERHALALALEHQRAAERELEARKRGEVERFARELRRRGEEAARKAADAIHQAVQRVETSRRAATRAGSEARGEALAAIRQAQDEVLQAPEVAAVVATPAPEVGGLPLGVGSRARVRSLGLVGEVLAIGSDGDVELAVSGKRLRLPARELVVLAPAGSSQAARPRTPSRAPGGGQTQSAATQVVDFPVEVRVIGQRVDEALPLVDKALDDAALSDRHVVRVVHGHGQGRLRQAVAELLAGHPHVARFALADAREGGAAVTVVELKE